MSDTSTNIMLDLETLDTSPYSIIVTIGAIKFDYLTKLPKFEELTEKNSFYRRLNIESSEKHGFTRSAETMEWWNKQDKAVRDEALTTEPRFDLKKVLKDFKIWAGDNTKIWSHGATFDCVILQEAYKIMNITPPWKYWDSRDTRTVYDLAGLKLNSANTKHHALNDCYDQILLLQESLTKLKI